MRIDNLVARKSIVAVFALLFCSFSLRGNAQMFNRGFFVPADTLDKRRMALVAGSWTAIYGSALVGLNGAWYNRYERTSFHTFNDLPEWQGMDKAGHIWTAYSESRFTAQALKWSGVKRGVSDIAGFGTAMVFQTTLEMFDAYSAKWGFSWGDIGANVIGAGSFYAQQLLWNEQRISIKLSFHNVHYKDEYGWRFQEEEAERVADLFGNTLAEKSLKDYNGQTYWISVNPSSFSKGFKPRWLNFAVGYGAEGLFGGDDNIWVNKDGTQGVFDVNRQVQIFLSPDIDFTRIRTRSPILRTVFTVLNIVKLPAPTLMLQTEGAVKFYPLYF
jgi:hypothetical protein